MDEKLKQLAVEILGEELATKMYGDESMGNPVSFSQLLEREKTREIADQVYDLSNLFRMLSFNICYNPMVEDKVGALESLTKEYLNLVKGATTQTKSSSLLDLIKELNPFKRKEKEEVVTKLSLKEGSNFYVFKDKNNKQRWLAIHSNNYEDRDNPKEIIASYAHIEFVEAVEKGLWPYPELWIWHATGKSRVGQADMLHYDNATGCMFSTGTFDDGKEHIAKGLAEYPEPLRTSHGMPKELLIYEGGLTYNQVMLKPEPHVIAFYRTKEISPLPFGAEANQLVAFSINGGK